eukprot:8757491-Pyramimonas_sp.AAC.1
MSRPCKLHGPGSHAIQSLELAVRDTALMTALDSANLVCCAHRNRSIQITAIHKPPVEMPAVNTPA